MPFPLHTPARDTLLSAEYPGGVALPLLLEHINALPGGTMSRRYLTLRVETLNLHRSPTFMVDMARRNGAARQQANAASQVITRPLCPIKDGAPSRADRQLREDVKASVIAPVRTRSDAAVLAWGQRWCPAASGSIETINVMRVAYGLPAFVQA